jgi:hypothetical protein
VDFARKWKKIWGDKIGKKFRGVFLPKQDIFGVLGGRIF